MVTFDNEETAALVRKKRILNGLNIVFLVVLVIESLIVAVLSKNAESNWGIYIALFVQLGTFWVLYVLYLIFFVCRAGAKLKYSVRETIADGFMAEEDFLTGATDIEFDVTYEGNELTVFRKGFKDLVEFDLKALKPLPSVYSEFGTYIWEFFQAYYTVRFKDGNYRSVRVTDNTTKRSFELNIVDDGELMGGSPNNYYIKKGLIK